MVMGPGMLSLCEFSLIHLVLLTEVHQISLQLVGFFNFLLQHLVESLNFCCKLLDLPIHIFHFSFTVSSVLFILSADHCELLIVIGDSFSHF